MDIEIHRELCKLIEDVSTSGSSSLDAAQCKAIKNICKKSDMYVKAAFTLLMDQIERDHAQIRLSCLFLIDQLFCRSHAFRLLLVDSLDKVMTLCIGTDVSAPLPRPKEVAQAMRQQAVKFVNDWNQKFGEHYKKLALGFGYLRNVKKVDFANLEARSNEERRRAEVQAQRKHVLLQRKLDAVKQQMDEMLADMERCLTEMESCYQLLLPSVSEFNPQPETASSTSTAAATDKANPATSPNPENHAHTSDARTSVKPLDVRPAGCGSDDRSKQRQRQCDQLPSDSVCQSPTTPTTDGDVALARSTSAGSARSAGSESARVGQRGARLSRVLSSSSTEDPDNMEEWEEDEEDDMAGQERYSSAHESLQHHGIASDYNLLLDARSFTHGGAGNACCITESEDNSDLLTTLVDNQRLMRRKFLPMSAAWLAVLTKHAQAEGELLRLVIDRRRELTASMEKYAELKITWRDKHTRHHGDAAMASTEDSSDDEGDFVDVPSKEGVEDFTVTDIELDQAIQASRRLGQSKSSGQIHAVARNGADTPAASAWSLTSACASQEAMDPTTIAAQLTLTPSSQQQQQSVLSQDTFVLKERASRGSGGDGGDVDAADSSNTKPASGLHAVAPTVRFDTDIMEWAEEKKAPPSIVKLDSLHRFWLSSENEPEFVNEELWEGAKRRSILFTGQFEPVKWSCRAPLPSGKLCLRRDRVKCPFHGPIVARDEQGQPVAAAAATALADGASDDETSAATPSLPAVSVSSSASCQPSQPTWQELEADVAAAVGLPDLSVRGRKKRKSQTKDKASSLVNLDAAVNTPKSRIAKRIFKKGAITRVSSVLDALDSKRGDDRFGNQWNYSFQND